MFRRVVVLAIILTLCAQVALAAAEGPRPVTPNDGFRYGMKVFRENVRLRLAFRAEQRAELMIQFAEARIAEFEALAEEAPEEIRERLLERHDRLLERAQEIIANRENVPEHVAGRLADARLRALTAVEAAQGRARDAEIAEKRIAMLQARQEFVLTVLERNAERMAENFVNRAEQALDAATQTMERQVPQAAQQARQRTQEALRRARQVPAR